MGYVYSDGKSPAKYHLILQSNRSRDNLEDMGE